MTKYYRWVIAFLCTESLAISPLFVRGGQFFHTFFRGNDEVLIGFYRLLSRQFFDIPTVVARTARFFHTLESGNLEAAHERLVDSYIAEPPD